MSVTGSLELSSIAAASSESCFHKLSLISTTNLPGKISSSLCNFSPNVELFEQPGDSEMLGYGISSFKKLSPSFNEQLVFSYLLYSLISSSALLRFGVIPDTSVNNLQQSFPWPINALMAS